MTDEAPTAGAPNASPLGAPLRRWLLVLGLVALDLALGAGASALGFGGHLIGVPAALSGLSAAILSPVFLLAASLEIAGLGFRAGLFSDRLFGPLLAGQVALLLLSPSTFAGASAPAGAIVLGAAVTTALFVVALQYLYRHKQLAAATSGYVVRWGLAVTVTGLGWAVWAIDGTSLLLLPAVLVQLGIAAETALRGPPAESEERIPWLLRPGWTFQVLLLTFLAEFFLGAVLDFEIAGPTFLQYIPFVPMTGTGAAWLGLVLYDGLWFAAAILASAWFLIVLGFTMGTLVLLRLKETHEPAQRYRMGLMVAVYGLAAVFIPSFASSTPLVRDPALANLPVLGWGFGLRAGGPFESGVFLAVLIMYASVGVLTVLFGRKALCSVMCGAAIFYQASAVSEMRKFNQTSRVGRYFLGSQLSTAYTVTASLALVSLFGISFLSVLHMLPLVRVANGQFDTAALPLPIELYFGALWFVMFVSTPYLGTYNCATTGFCHWGSLSIPFARVSFFRLKVKDKGVCQRCTTFDCAKACPVGLVDMPQFFRTTGEYRSTKCCGVGDCVGACPYGNMYHQDVRFWVRRKLSRADPARSGTPLPMVRAKAPSAPTVVTAGQNRL
jgi:hypothetical protein